MNFTIGDKTPKLTKKKQKKLARKSLARKTKEPRHTLSPQWNVVKEETITKFPPQTITIVT